MNSNYFYLPKLKIYLNALLPISIVEVWVKIYLVPSIWPASRNSLYFSSSQAAKPFKWALFILLDESLFPFLNRARSYKRTFYLFLRTFEVSSMSCMFQTKGWSFRFFTDNNDMVRNKINLFIYCNNDKACAVLTWVYQRKAFLKQLDLSFSGSLNLCQFRKGCWSKKTKNKPCP